MSSNTIKLLGIGGFSFWTGKESKKLKCRKLTGPEKLILFTEINIIDTFPEVEHCEQIQAMWRELSMINKLLSIRPSELTQTTAQTSQRSL